jgi:hypothetical protein
MNDDLRLLWQHAETEAAARPGPWPWPTLSRRDGGEHGPRKRPLGLGAVVSVALLASAITPSAASAAAADARAPETKTLPATEVIKKEAAMQDHDPVFVQSTVDRYRKQFFDGWWDKTEVPAGPHGHLWFHRRQMEAAGWREPLDIVVAVSGASALFGYVEDGFMPKYAFHRVGVAGRVTKATGFGYEWVRYQDVDDAWRILKESVDAGKPVSAAHVEDVLFAGYQDAVAVEDRKVFAIALEPEDYGTWWSWKQFSRWSKSEGKHNGQRLGRHTKREEAEDPATVALRVMKDLVEWSQSPPESVRKAFPKAIWGVAAITACAEHCADIEGRKKWGFCHNLNSQWPTRKSTAAYLRKVAADNLFSEDVSKRLDGASDLYQKAYDEWVVAYKNVSWGGPDGGDANPENRKTAAAALRRAADAERAAIGEIEKILPLLSPMPAPAKASGNIYARGMSAILSHLGDDVSYDRIMGLSGVAFILQVETSGPIINGDELDCAWWPNDDWGFELGLPVLSKATGIEISKLECDMKAYRADPAAEYRSAFAPAVEASLAAGKPVLSYGFIATESDDKALPLLGYGTGGKSTCYRQKQIRLGRHPWHLYVIGDDVKPASAEAVDVASLRHIIALFNEDAQGPGAPETRFSGRQAWTEWLRLLRDNKACDNNMLIHLRYNRKSAVAYLRDMAGRYKGEAAAHLLSAADLYQQSLAELMKQGLPYNRVKSGEPEQVVRADYTGMVEACFEMESAAIAEISKALIALTGSLACVGGGPRRRYVAADPVREDLRIMY